MFSAMLIAMNEPMATRPFQHRAKVSAWFTSRRLCTRGASEQIWKQRCAQVRVTGKRKPACPRVYRFRRLSEEFRARYSAIVAPTRAMPGGLAAVTEGVPVDSAPMFGVEWRRARRGETSVRRTR